MAWYLTFYSFWQFVPSVFWVVGYMFFSKGYFNKKLSEQDKNKDKSYYPEKYYFLGYTPDTTYRIGLILLILFTVIGLFVFPLLTITLLIMFSAFLAMEFLQTSNTSNDTGHIYEDLQLDVQCSVCDYNAQATYPEQDDRNKTIALKNEVIEMLVNVHSIAYPECEGEVVIE